MISIILAFIGGYMPTFFKCVWNGQSIHTVPPKTDFRGIPYINPAGILFFPLLLLPYFWDTNVCLDLRIRPPKGKTKDRIWTYHWELQDLDKTSVNSGNGVAEISTREIRKNGYAAKERAIDLEYLHPNKAYRLFITLKSEDGMPSPEMFVSSFTIKDRDEFYMQTFIALFVLSMGIIIGVVAKGCGL